MIAALSLLFLAPRLLLLFGRVFFFDELYTLWLSPQPWRAIVAALRVDSGPPLYYAVVHLLFSITTPAVRLARALSLVAGFGSMVVVLRARELGAMRFSTALFLTVFPPAVLFASDARAYAICALFVTAASVALDRWITMQARAWLVIGAVAILLAAYSHFYGVLFFPLPFVIGLLARRRERIVEGVCASAAAGIAFIPGFWLARVQPAGAIGWLAARAPHPLAPLASVGAAARYPEALFAPVPIALVIAALLLFIVAVARTATSPRALRFAAMTLVPLLGVIAMTAAGSAVYFPMRFESLLAPPLLLWTASALDGWSTQWRRVLTVAIVTVALIACYRGVVDHLQRPLDPYHAAALFARTHVPSGVPIVVSGYLYLELAAQREAAWQPHIISFPPEQAVHPGWRAVATASELTRSFASIAAATPQFVWIGERGTAEWRIIRSRADTQTLFADGPAIILRCRLAP